MNIPLYFLGPKSENRPFVAEVLQLILNDHVFWRRNFYPKDPTVLSYGETRNKVNEDFKEQYFDIAAELRNIIQLKRDNFACFEEIFIFIFKKISDGNRIRGKRHIFTLLHYMYYECLIGVR